MSTVTINGHKFSAYLSEGDLVEAQEIADLIKEGNYPMAKENFDCVAEQLDSMQIIALRDAVKHYS